MALFGERRGARAPRSQADPWRLAPPTSAYGRGYAPQWPEAAIDGMSDAQMAVMAPPYHPRMNRVSVDREGHAVSPRPREGFKVEFDERVFGTRYF